MLLSSHVWGRYEHNEEERVKVAVAAMETDLHNFYKSKYRERPRVNLTRISHLTVKMVGSNTKFKLGLKAMETFGFLLFLIHMTRTHAGRIGAAAASMIESGECITEYLTIVKVVGARHYVEVLQAMHDKFNISVGITKPGPRMTAPKVHLMMEMNVVATWHGSPWIYQVFLDESLHHIPNMMLRNCHKSNVEWLALQQSNRGLQRLDEKNARSIL